MSTQYELSKLFKPVTNMHNDLKEGLVSELKPIREGMKNLPKAITFPQFPMRMKKRRTYSGDVAEQYLRKFATTSGADKTFGLRDNNGKFYIRNKEAKIKENNIIVDDKEYADTPEI